MSEQYYLNLSRQLRIDNWLKGYLTTVSIIYLIHQDVGVKLK